MNKLVAKSGSNARGHADPHVAEVSYPGYGKHKETIYKRVVIPLALHGFILLLCSIRHLHYLESAGRPDIYKYSSATLQLIEYLTAHYDNPSSVPTEILRIYSLHLSGKGIEPSSVRSLLTSFNVMLKWSISQPWFSELKTVEKNYILKVYANRPTIYANPMLDGTASTMSELVSEADYDDLELLDSLTHFCLGFLTMMMEHRTLLRKNPKIMEHINELTDINDPAWDYVTTSRKGYDEIFNTIIESGNPGLLERLVFSFPASRQQILDALAPASLDELFISCKRFVRDSGSLMASNSDGSINSLWVINFQQLDLRSIASITYAEEIALRWLLAADRIQQAGQDQLTLADFDITPTHLSISYLKKRSINIERESTSHKKKTYNYRILSYYYDLRAEFSARFDDLPLERIMLFQHLNPFTKRMILTSQSSRPIIHACALGSNLGRLITNKFPKAHLFQKYFMTLMKSNTVLTKDNKERLKISGSKRNLADPSPRALTANVIAHSRSIIDSDISTGNASISRGSKDDLLASTEAHDSKTAHDVYRRRSKTTHRLGIRKEFVHMVGNLQESEARKLNALMERTNIVSLAAIDELLGWEHLSFNNKDLADFNKLLASAEEQGFSCTPFGYLHSTSYKQRLVVTIPAVGALILSYIEGCKAELKKSSSDARNLAIVLNVCYADMVLQMFDKKTLLESQELLATLSFPPPVI